MSVVIFHRFWHPKRDRVLHSTLGTSPNIAYMSVVVCAANLTRSVLGYCNHRVGVWRFKIVVYQRADTNNNNAHTIGVAVTIGITMWFTNLVINIGHIWPYKIIKSDKRKIANGKYNKVLKPLNKYYWREINTQRYANDDKGLLSTLCNYKAVLNGAIVHCKVHYAWYCELLYALKCTSCWCYW